jgi:hypothetical protein
VEWLSKSLWWVMNIIIMATLCYLLQKYDGGLSFSTLLLKFQIKWMHTLLIQHKMQWRNALLFLWQCCKWVVEGKTCLQYGLHRTLKLTPCSCRNMIDLSAPHDTICSWSCVLRNRTAVIDDEWSSSVWTKLYSCNESEEIS